MGSIAAKKVGEKKCQICGFDRVVDRCHIFPVRLIELMFPLSKMRTILMDYDGLNTIYLCRNHHFLFDHFTLKKEEFDIIKDYYAKILELLTATIKNEMNDSRVHDEFIDAFIKWNDKVSGFIQQNYANK
jgi:hypothetical protein